MVFLINSKGTLFLFFLILLKTFYFLSLDNLIWKRIDKKTIFFSASVWLFKYSSIAVGNDDILVANPRKSYIM